MVLVHDERLVAQTLLAVLRDALPECDVVLAAVDRPPRCDVLVAPDRLWRQGVVHAAGPLLLIGDDRRVDVTALPDGLRDGVRGWVPSSADAVEVRTAVQAVLAGEVWVAGQYAQRTPRIPRQPVPVELTPREREVLALLGDGLTNRQMSSRLGLSEATVRTLRQRLFHKLDVHSASEALARAAAASSLHQR